MVNHFKTALMDPDVIRRYKDKPYHMAVLHALAAYRDKGNSLLDLPWFPLANTRKESCGYRGSMKALPPAKQV